MAENRFQLAFFDFGGRIMLVLSRKVGQRIFIGESISITVVKVAGGGVRIGIDAPSELSIIREELRESRENRGRKVAVASA